MNEFKTPSPRSFKHNKDVRSSFFLSLSSSEIEERVHNNQHYERSACIDDLEYINSNLSLTETAAKYNYENTPVYTTQSSNTVAQTSPSKHIFVDATVKPVPLGTYMATPGDDNRQDDEVKQSLKSVREQLFDLDAKLAAISIPKTIDTFTNSSGKDVSTDVKSISTQDTTDNSFTNNSSSEVDEDDMLSTLTSSDSSSIRESTSTSSYESKQSILIESTNNLYADDIQLSPMMQKEDECQACIIM